MYRIPTEFLQKGRRTIIVTKQKKYELILRSLGMWKNNFIAVVSTIFQAKQLFYTYHTHSDYQFQEKPVAVAVAAVYRKYLAKLFRLV